MARFRFATRLGLRARITLFFALSGLLLAAMLSVITYTLTREILLRQRDENAVSRVLQNAAQVANELKDAGDPNFATLLGSLRTPEGAFPIINYDETWNAKNAVEFGSDAIPVSLQASVTEGQPARMRTEYRGQPYLVVGVKIPTEGPAAYYYEGVPLSDTADVLRTLGLALFGASTITALAGGLAGYWLARRIITPLSDIGHAAEAIAEGELDTRLDVTGDPDLDKLTSSFNEMVAALDGRIQRDARFASEVSHELRSPLMTLAASVEVLENSRDDLPERARTALDLMSADIERFQQLVEDLLEISRFDVGAVTLHLEEVLVTEMVIQAVNVSSGGTVPIRYDEEADQIVVAVDKRRFSRVLANLLDNARKYAGGATAVRIELARSDPASVGPPDRVRIAVEDAGHGVPADERDAIFDRFSRGTEGGNRGTDSGVGLGLSLVDEHVRLHGGSVWVEDRHDGKAGARFVVELPAVDLASEPEPPDDQPPLDAVPSGTEAGAAP